MARLLVARYLSEWLNGCVTIDGPGADADSKPITRRTVLAGAAGVVALGWGGYGVMHRPDTHVGVRSAAPAQVGDAPVTEVVLLVSPGFWPVDIIGLHTAFGLIPGVKLHLVWKSTDEVMGFPTFPARPTTTYDDCPRDVTVLYAGATDGAVFEDAETLEFLADRGSRARWVAGSCTGTLLLGAAGLLRGYRATTNFQAAHLLPYVGATHAPGNVVEDRNRITAGPATGGFEIAFRLIQDIYGDEAAREAILQAEYAPSPLFNVGTPELAGPELTDRARARTAPAIQSLHEIMKRTSARLLLKHARR